MIAAADKMSWDGRDAQKWRPGRQFTRSQIVELALPAELPVNRAFWLTLSFWEYEGNVAIRPLPVGSQRSPACWVKPYIILDEVVLPATCARAPGRTETPAQLCQRLSSFMQQTIARAGTGG